MGDGRIRREAGYRRVSPRGATRPATESGLSPAARRWLNRSLGLLLTAIVLGGSWYFAAEPVRQFFVRPVASVAVEGEFRHVSQERVMEVISTAIDRDFLQLDLARLKHTLEAEPWIESASLARRWPDVLQVRIVEERPIARWGDSGFLNQRGEIIDAQQVGDLAGLPWLQHDAGDSVAVMRRYLELSQMFRSRGLSITELHSDSKDAWRLTLNNGVEVNVGRGNMREKMGRLLLVHDRYLVEYLDEVEAIDIRYRNGVAVRWRNDEDVL